MGTISSHKIAAPLPNHKLSTFLARSRWCPHEGFYWHTPDSVLLGLPLCHTEVTSIPLAFTERVRDYASSPLPLFLRRSRLLLPRSEGLWKISPSCLPFQTVAKLVLLCAFLHLTDIRPANIEWSILRPSSFQENFLAAL